MNPFHHAILASIESYFESLYYDSNGTISEFKPLDPFNNFQIGKNPVDGFYYFVTQTVGGSPYNRSQFVFKFLFPTMTIVQVKEIKRHVGITEYYDSHLQGSVNFDSDGRIYILIEKGLDSATTNSNGHNTDMLLHRTETPGDLDSFALWKTLPGRYSYTKLWIDGTTFYASARGKRSVANTGVSTMEKSIDNGATWNNYEFIDTSLSSPLRRSYNNTLHNFDGNEMFLIVNLRNEETSAFESVSLIKSTDGITWRNINNSTSRNAASSEYFNLADLHAAPSLIWIINPATHAVNFEGGCVQDGVVKVLISKSVKDGPVNDNNTVQTFQELRLYTYGGSGWEYKDLSALLPLNYSHLWAIERTLQFVPGAVEDMIVVIDKTGATDIVKKYGSTDGFETYTETEIFNKAGSYYYGSHSFNTNEEGKRIVILNDTQGAFNDFNSSSNLEIIAI